MCQCKWASKKCGFDISYFKLEDSETVFVRGAKDKGDVKNTDGLKKAYQLGTTI